MRELDDISNLNRNCLGRNENDCKIQSQLDLLQIHYDLSVKYALDNQSLLLLESLSRQLQRVSTVNDNHFETWGPFLESPDN